MRFTLLLLGVLVLLPVFASVAYGEVEPLKVLYDYRLDRSVVMVIYASKQYGTGWWVNSHYLVTAAHVTDYQQGVPVTVIHGSYTSRGVVVAVDKNHDIEVIRVNNPMPNATILPLCKTIAKGEEAIVVGYPFEIFELVGDVVAVSINPRAAYGTVAWLGSKDKWYLAEIQATTDEGNSGGPAIDLDVHCALGAVTFALKGAAGTMYYVTNVHAIRQLLDAANVSYSVKDNTASPPDYIQYIKQQEEEEEKRIMEEKMKYAVGGGAAGMLFVLFLTVMKQAGGATARRMAIILLLASTPILAAKASAFTPTLLVGNDTGTTAIPLKGRVLGGILPGYAYVFPLHAEASYGKFIYRAAGAGIEVKTNPPISVGIDIRPVTPILPPFLRAYLVIALGEEKLWEKSIGIVPPMRSASWDANVYVRYHCDGRLDIEVSGGGVSHSETINVNPPSPLPVYGIAGKSGDVESYVDQSTYGLIENCGQTYTNPWGEPTRTVSGSDDSSKNNNNTKDKYMLYGVVAVAGVAVLLLALRGSSGVTVVRGMLPLIAVLVLGGVVFGAAVAWKLKSSVDQAARAEIMTIPLIVFIVAIVLVVLARRNQIVIVEAGGR